MPQNVAFHLGLHCLLRQNHLQREEAQDVLEPHSIYNGPSHFIALSFMENSLILKGLNRFSHDKVIRVVGYNSQNSVVKYRFR